MTTPDSDAAPGPETPARRGADRAPGDAGDSAAERARVLGGEPVLPEQSPEDTDAGWGEYPETGDDRLHRDRPPHWADY